MADGAWKMTAEERRTLERALDALLPPEGSFPAPSECGVIDGFILRRVGTEKVEAGRFPRVNVEDLKRILATLQVAEDMTAALEELEAEDLAGFLALWLLAVYGYYSRPEVIQAIQTDLGNAYHGAPLPHGYAHVLTPWDSTNPLEMPRQPAGSYIPTDKVERVDLRRLEGLE